MKKIILLCNMGMSTSLLVNKMTAHAKTINYDCEISAHAVSKAPDIVPQSDIVLIGPQISYELDRLKKAFPDKEVMAINMIDYGQVNGKKVLEDVMNIIGK